MTHLGEPDGWSGLDELVAASTRLALAGVDGVALALSTEDQRPQIVAERVPDALRARAGQTGAGG